MIFELVIVFFGILLDYFIGDPRNRYHPTAWMGILIGKITPKFRNNKTINEKLGGFFLTIIVTSAILIPVILFTLNFHYFVENNFSFENSGILLIILANVILAIILFKLTLSIKGLEQHALDIRKSLLENEIDLAQNQLSRIVKRDTKNLNKKLIISGTLESISENTVDGITGPLFYFGLLGLPGAFLYRVINTLDSMVGYKNTIFSDLGWFSANCDKILNFLPARLTGLLVVFSAWLMGLNWQNSFAIMKRDSSKPTSLNSGFPMSAFAGALETQFEKIGNYQLGEQNSEINEDQILVAISLMKVTSIVFSLIIVLPSIVILAYLGVWLHV